MPDDSDRIIALIIVNSQSRQVFQELKLNKRTIIVKCNIDVKWLFGSAAICSTFVEKWTQTRSKKWAGAKKFYMRCFRKTMTISLPISTKYKKILQTMALVSFLIYISLVFYHSVYGLPAGGQQVGVCIVLVFLALFELRVLCCSAGFFVLFFSFWQINWSCANFGRWHGSV